jgi:predicted flap endonuclease-1-like 5' DNA nuclease
MPMWEVFYRRWLDFAFWWLPRKEAPSRDAEAAPARGPQQEGAAKPGAPAAPERPVEPPAPEPSPAPAARSAAARPEKTVAPPVPDDLTVIKGIGPAVQNKLRALGITTFADLAAADPDAILRQLKGSQPLTRGKVQAWTKAARERARP